MSVEGVLGWREVRNNEGRGVGGEKCGRVYG